MDFTSCALRRSFVTRSWCVAISTKEIIAWKTKVAPSRFLIGVHHAISLVNRVGHLQITHWNEQVSMQKATAKLHVNQFSRHILSSIDLIIKRLLYTLPLVGKHLDRYVSLCPLFLFRRLCYVQLFDIRRCFVIYIFHAWIRIAVYVPQTSRRDTIINQ